LTVDDRGVKALIDEKCYRSAIALTSRLLTNNGQGYGQKGNNSLKHSIHSLQLWHTRLSLLVKINEIEIARKEAEAFGHLDNLDVFYEHQQPVQYKSKYGSMASFSFRLFLAAELPLKLNKHQDALNNLLKIYEVVRKIYKFFTDLGKKNEAEFWKDRNLKVMSLMITCAMQLKNFDLAHQLFASIDGLPNLSSDVKLALSSAWGRT
jgi:trafficking protein particle complex subunit 12